MDRRRLTFTGKYVPAAVIHDVDCKTYQYTWQDTDRMFYDAMLDAGESELHAKLLYWGVVQLAGPLALKFAIPLPPETILQKADACDLCFGRNAP